MADQPTTIFKQEQQTADAAGNTADQTTSATTSQNPYEDLLKGIVNEQGEQKYRSIEDALVGLRHAQEFIPKLKDEKRKEEEELQRLREEVAKLKALEDTVAELASQRASSPTSDGMTPDAVAALVQKTLQDTQIKQTQEQNLNSVVSVMRDKFGDKAETVFYEKAQEMGLTVTEINELAAKTPKAVLTMLGVSGDGAHKQPQFNPTKGTVNTTTLTPKPTTFLSTPTKSVMLGATTRDVLEASQDAKKMAEELHSQGLTIDYLTDPKNYFKHF